MDKYITLDSGSWGQADICNGGGGLIEFEFVGLIVNGYLLRSSVCVTVSCQYGGSLEGYRVRHLTCVWVWGGGGAEGGKGCDARAQEGDA